MLRSRLLSLLGLGFSAWGSSSLAQTSPAPVLGHPLGESFTRHHAVVDYVTHMAEVMPHWELEEYGTTTEGRPLLGLIMSSPANMANLETLRAVVSVLQAHPRYTWPMPYETAHRPRLSLVAC